MAMTLRQLQIFAKVAERESVSRAAEEMALTQSAVSMALSELERYSDAPLFNRQGKRLHLNDRGRQLLPLVATLQRQYQEIEMFLDESLLKPRGILHVGASTTIGNYLMPELITRFSQSYPEATVLLQVGNAAQIETGLARGELDVGLSEGFQMNPALTARKWRDDELVIVTGPQHPWVTEKQIGPEQLQQAAWIVREHGSGTRDVFEAALKEKQISCTVAMELGHTEAIKKAVEAGAGCACLSRMAVQRELDHGWLVEIATCLNLKRDLILLTKEGSYRSILFQTFCDGLFHQTS
ncbi:LysR substrate-binding domain-containing protein [uncultured Desulfuromonas sp.]|uniref:LysR substrate-binding domain-containing protein n=1 Tax=uncultured Desulfuromonas sp. TaxID=181013 RepID=UPI002AAAB284|nr:LysR substrate-binding domain-containing protein [uncultured Desulfuromonas sp.]